ncbi:MAG: hypothetical protein CVV49_16755 [Spirochaetae bacterium HGW-Spirochaetae-5]|jgi:hypothetical protein|nr:MAG: hypothetical protein CVV49_16755 [Spirochaetae bacterium HGW-Spirochaetae-5]
MKIFQSATYSKILLFLIISLAISYINCNDKSHIYVISPRGINLRSNPSIKSEVLALIPFKAEISIIANEKISDVHEDIKGNWVKVNYQNKIGWIFDIYTSTEKPKISTSTSLQIFKSIMKNILSEKIAIANNTFEFGLTPDEILKRFGKPNGLGNGSGFGYFAYNGCLIGFDDFFNGTEPTLDNYKLFENYQYKTAVLYLFLKEDISLDDLFNTYKNSVEMYFNGHDSKWECKLKLNDKIILFQFEKLNNYLETIIVAKVI